MLPAITIPIDKPKQIDHLKVGEWFWVKGDEEKGHAPPLGSTNKKYTRLGCITDVGSNHIKIKEPDYGRHDTHFSCRIHFDDVDDELIHEPNPELIINKTLQYYQIETNQLMTEVKDLTARLGISSHAALENKSGNGSGTELAILSENSDPNEHKKLLIKAKDETLPELFEAIKVGNKSVAKWMSAELLPMLIESGNLTDAIGVIETRIFHISLYAGLTEEIEKVRDGAQAKYEDKVHLMQRMMYMDEECLLDYKKGGMEFKEISQFDEWLSKPNNLNRCLPFPKCVVLFRVRRSAKERSANTILQAFINIKLEKLDSATFMYIRNGNELYRLATDIDFDEKMFPDVGAFDLNQPMMTSTWGGGGKNFLMTKMEYDQIISEMKEKKCLAKKWEKNNPYLTWKKEKAKQSLPEGGRWDLSKYGWNYENPYTVGSGIHGSSVNGFRGDLHDYKPFDSTNLYYDDIMEQMYKEMERFNRVSLILQGILDRSPILHPHPKAETWKPEGFELIYKLVYDASMVLTYGEDPSFEDYWKQCNTLIDKNSVFIGQEDYWKEKEAIKENKRRDNSYGQWSNHNHVERYSPCGNDGPGFVTKPSNVQLGAKKATFTWYRERNQWRMSHLPKIKTKITVPFEKLFNVSGYKPGDYKLFFQDPRTRPDYIKWAPFLLGAEDYHQSIKKNIKRKTLKK